MRLFQNCKIFQVFLVAGYQRGNASQRIAQRRAPLQLQEFIHQKFTSFQRIVDFCFWGFVPQHAASKWMSGANEVMLSLGARASRILIFIQHFGNLSNFCGEIGILVTRVNDFKFCVALRLGISNLSIFVFSQIFKFHKFVYFLLFFGRRRRPKNWKFWWLEINFLRVFCLYITLFCISRRKMEAVLEAFFAFLLHI